MRVRGIVDSTHFKAITLNIPDGIVWQDWILTDSVFNTELGDFRRDRPPFDRKNTTARESGKSGGTRALELNDKAITDILAATHPMPSCNACQIEGTGTAENVDEYFTS